MHPPLLAGNTPSPPSRSPSIHHPWGAERLEASMVVASKPWSAIGEALVQGLHKIYCITLGEKENLKKHKNSGSNMFLTYVLRRETIKVSPKRGDPPPLHHISPSDETILHRLTLKRHDSLQDL